MILIILLLRKDLQFLRTITPNQIVYRILFSFYIRSKLKEGRIGAAVCMHCSYKSLMKFRGNVCFREVTVSYLNQYELWLRSKEVSKTTISIYVRGLRTIFNEAIDAG